MVSFFGLLLHVLASPFKSKARLEAEIVFLRIGQAPAPFHVIPRGWAGPSLLAMILFEKYGPHQPAQPPGRTLRPRGRALGRA
jgi:hypothetical protein